MFTPAPHCVIPNVQLWRFEAPNDTSPPGQKLACPLRRLSYPQFEQTLAFGRLLILLSGRSITVKAINIVQLLKTWNFFSYAALSRHSHAENQRSSSSPLISAEVLVQGY